MNVPLPGEASPYGFPIVCGVAALITAVVAIIFRKKDLF